MLTAEEKKKHAAYMRAYNAANNDKVNAQRRARRTSECLQREQRWRKENREKVLAYKAVDRMKRPADYKRWKDEWAARNALEIKRRQHDAYLVNKERQQSRAKAAYRRDHGPAKRRAVAWAKAHPEQVRQMSSESQGRRRAQKVSTQVARINHRAIYERDGHRCGICRKIVAWANFNLDHIVPLSRGGPHIESNVQTAHRSCNARKGNRGPAQPRLSL